MIIADTLYDTSGKLLTNDEEKRLCEKLKNGDKQAKEKLVKHNIKLVFSIVKYYQNRGCDNEDLIQEGILGLMNGIDNFDHTKGNKLSTYVTYWIRQRIQRYIQNHGKVVRIPVHVQNLSANMKKVIDEYRKEFNTDPSIEEICKLIDCSYEMVKSAMENNLPNHVIQLDHTPGRLHEKEETEYHEIFEDKNAYNPFEILSNIDMTNVIKKSLKKLSPRDEAILRLRFGISEPNKKSENFSLSNDEMDELIKRKENE